MTHADADIWQRLADQLREQDHDRYLITLFTGSAQRKALHALFALNLELAKTREVVSEPMLGEIRLTWWRETIEEARAGAPKEHDGAQALADLLAQHDLPRDWMEEMLNARLAEVEGREISSLQDMTAYVAATAGRLNQMAMRICAPDQKLEEAARLAGIAYGLAGLMRALPVHAQRGWVYLPKEMLRDAGLTDPTAPDALQTEALARVLQQIADTAETYLRDAKQVAGRFARPATAPLLMGTMARQHLKVLRKAGYVPDAADYERAAGGRLWKLIWAAVTKQPL